LIDSSGAGSYTRSNKGYFTATLDRTVSTRFSWQARGSWLRTHFTDVNPDDWAVSNRFGAEWRGVGRNASGRVVTAGVEAARGGVVVRSGQHRFSRVLGTARRGAVLDGGPPAARANLRARGGQRGEGYRAEDPDPERLPRTAARARCLARRRAAPGVDRHDRLPVSRRTRPRARFPAGVPPQASPHAQRRLPLAHALRRRRL